MAITFAKLFGSRSVPEGMPGELRTLLLQMRQERNAVEALVARAEAAAVTARELSEPVARASRSLDELRGQLTAMEPVVPDLTGRVAAIAAQADALAETQARGEAALAASLDTTALVKSDVEAIRAELGDLATVRSQMADVLALREAVADLRAQLEGMTSHLATLRAERDAIRTQHDAMLTEHREAVAGIQRIAAQFDTVRADVAETAQRVADLRELIDPVAELVRGVPEARRELATLQALREYVAQKVAALEEQRGLVDRATDRGERLGALLQRLDGEIKEQGQNFKFLAKVKDHVDELRLRHGELLEQAARIGAEHRRLLEEDEAVRRYAGALRSEITEDLERAASRFALERESVDAVSEQVSGLREALADAERRFRPLEEATMTVGELGVEAGRLAERFEEVAREVARLDPEAERVRSLRAEVTEVEADLREVVRRVESVREPSLAAVEQAEQRVEELAQQVAHLEERTSQVEGTAATLHHLGREVERRRVAVEQGLEELARAAVFRDEAHQVAERLAERVATLAAAGAAAEERVAGVERLFGELERRTDRLVVARAEMDAFEEKLAGWRTMESRVGRATAQAADRQALLESLRADVTRLFAVAEEAAAQARIAVDARAEIVAGRTMLDDVLEQLREIRVEASGLDARRERLADEDARLARAEALVLDLRGSLETLAAQREFLDQVVATAGALRFQSRQAEALVEALREAGEAGGSIVSR